mmetsp:Transcript_7104/g.26599  ORF Transcript_7104/g.26599 Transcript_7104/m.26599 type:complete len:111 (-) Transcript_7104:3344-3676(-)
MASGSVINNDGLDQRNEGQQCQQDNGKSRKMDHSSEEAKRVSCVVVVLVCPAAAGFMAPVQTAAHTQIGVATKKNTSDTSHHSQIPIRFSTANEIQRITNNNVGLKVATE